MKAKNKKKILRWLERIACLYSVFLWTSLCLGQTTIPNELIAFAEKGNVEAQAYVGYNYYLNQEYQKAVKWLKKAAKKSNTIAQYHLGVCYFEGQGVEQDYHQSFLWFREAEQAGLLEAMNAIAKVIDSGINADNIRIRGWYTNDYHNWCYKTFFKRRALVFDRVHTYEIGKVRESLGNKEAIDIFMESAKREFIPSQRELGRIYYEGSLTEQNSSEAVSWWRRAANNGDYESQYLLGCSYIDGVGVERDYNEGIYWIERSIENGYPFSKAKDKLREAYFRNNSIDETRFDYLEDVANEESEWECKLKRLYNDVGYDVLFTSPTTFSNNIIDSTIISTIERIEQSIVSFGPISWKKDKSEAYKNREMDKFNELIDMHTNLVSNVLHGFVGSGKDYKTSKWKKMAPQIRAVIIDARGKTRIKVMSVDAFFMNYILKHKMNVTEAEVTSFILYPVFRRPKMTSGMLLAHYWPFIDRKRKYIKKGDQLQYQENSVNPYSLESMKPAMLDEYEMFKMSFLLGDLEITIKLADS